MSDSVVVSVPVIEGKMFFNVYTAHPEFINSAELCTGSNPSSSSNATQSELSKAVEKNEDSPSIFLQTTDLFDILYIPFAYDFGPPSIGQIYKFVKMMNRVRAHQPNKKLVWYSLSSDLEATTNAACLMGGYCIFSLGWTASEVEEKFMSIRPYLQYYRDASQGPVNYHLDLFTCFRAMKKAKDLGWINFTTFNLAEYQYYEQVEHGDFNWIIPEKFIAMCTPTAVARRTETTVSHTPEYYIQYFTQRNVTTVIRLNTVEYDRNSFLKVGIDHHDMYFIDGTVPPMNIVDKFLEVVEKAPGAIAVHCKQGLGRTGSLLACYIMKHYDLNAPEAIAFLRLQRPGSVVGPQQHFLHKIEPIMKAAPKKLSIEPSSPTPAVLPPSHCGGSPAVISLKRTSPYHSVTPSNNSFPFNLSPATPPKRSTPIKA